MKVGHIARLLVRLLRKLLLQKRIQAWQPSLPTGDEKDPKEGFEQIVKEMKKIQKFKSGVERG